MWRSISIAYVLSVSGMLLAGCQEEALTETKTTTSTLTETDTTDSGQKSDTESSTTLETHDTAVKETGIDLDLAQRVTLAGLMTHLEMLSAIAEENSGTRAAGTAGFQASVDYAKEVFETAGYTVQLDEFSFSVYEEVEDSILEQTAPVKTLYDPKQFSTFTYTGSGNATAAVTAVSPTIPPGAKENSSDSGCDAAHFTGFSTGNIALIQRGTCTFADKVANAEAAGASAVVIFNEGQEGRRGVLSGTLDGGNPATIPVLGISYNLGAAFVGLADAGVLELTVFAEVLIEDRVCHNVLAERGVSAGQPVVVVGAHLDSVQAGSGMNDNGTGTATVLESAIQAANMDLKGAIAVRYALWGAEEYGLLGSNDYVASLDGEQLTQIVANLNYDMVGSPNGGRFIYDGDGSDSKEAGPEGSAELEDIYERWFDSQGLSHSPTAFSNRSDYAAFTAVGIPAGGLFTGAEAIKTKEEAASYGGVADEPYDACYHLACDNLDNVDQAMFLEMAQAAAYAVQAVVEDEAWAARSRSRTPVKPPAVRPTGHVLTK